MLLVKNVTENIENITIYILVIFDIHKKNSLRLKEKTIELFLKDLDFQLHFLPIAFHF
jgi:hypothetical protein